MDYKLHYDRLIERSLNRSLSEGYYERHHIIPRCLGGSDESVNIALLTPEEHYVAHQLLVKMYPNNAKLVYAAQMMIPNRPSNKLYGWLRRKFSNVVSERQRSAGNSQHGTKWITDGIRNSKIKKEEDIPKGWYIGRTVEKKNKMPVPKMTKVRVCKSCKDRENILKRIKAKHTNIRKSESYRRAKSIRLYKEFVNSGMSLRNFAISKNLVPMTLSNWFREFIPDYQITPRVSANKQV